MIAEAPIFKGVGLITEGKQTNNCAAIYLQLVEEFSSLQQFKDEYFCHKVIVNYSIRHPYYYENVFVLVLLYGLANHLKGTVEIVLFIN